MEELHKEIINASLGLLEAFKYPARYMLIPANKNPAK